MANPTIIPKSSYYDGFVTEGDRARARAGAPDFTVGGANQLTLSAHPTIPFALVVSKGTASAFGVTAFVETALGGNLVIQCDSQTSGTRWDLIMIRYDWRPDAGGPSELRAINAGGKQLPSTLESTPGNLVDQPLWLVRWTGNASAPAEYVDLRCFAANQGMTIMDILALGYLEKPGASVKLGEAQYDFRLIGNGVWDWRETGDFRLIGAPTGWSLGPLGFSIDRVPLAGGRNRYFLNAQLVREAEAFAIGNKPLGALAPVGYRPPDSIDFYGGLNTRENRYLGALSVRMTAGGTFVLNPVDADYIIEKFGNINFAGSWVR